MALIAAAVASDAGASASQAGLLSGGILFWFMTNLMPVAVLFGDNPNAGVTVFSLVPVVVLLISGYKVSSGSRANGFAAGACVVAGYLPLTLLSYVFISGSTSGYGALFSLFTSFLKGTMLLIGLTVIGVVMPVLFGGLGGVLSR